MKKYIMRLKCENKKCNIYNGSLNKSGNFRYNNRVQQRIEKIEWV